MLGATHLEYGVASSGLQETRGKPVVSLQYSSRKRRRTMIAKKFTLVGIATGVLSISAMFSFHPRTEVHLPSWNIEETLAIPDQPTFLHQQRARARRKRTRPPSLPQTSDGTYQVWSNSQGEIDLWNSSSSVDSKGFSWCGTEAQSAAKAHPQHFPPHLILSQQSRVIITNAFTSIGMHLALQLSQLCHVSQILALDDMLPNTRRHRMQEMERYALLTRRIPAFQKLLVPYNGILPKLDVDIERLRSFAPTHIVHLTIQEESKASPLYLRRQKLQSMEQLLQYIKNTTDDDAMTPHLIYAGPDLFFEHLLANSYQNFYHIASIGVEMPHTYGPWEHEGSWPWDLAQRVVHPINNSYVTSKDESFLYVEDASSAIISSMQLRRTNTMIRLTSNVTTASIESAMQKHVAYPTPLEKKSDDSTNHWQDLIHWVPITSTQVGVKKLISWYYTHAFPYGESYFRKLPQYVVENHHYQFPCASECSIPASCYKTAYDNVISLAKEKTKKCRLAVYMVNLSKDITSLPPAVKPSVDETLSNYICNLAFVSNTSVILSNGSANGWSLIPVPDDGSAMTEAEYILPKLSPGNFFSSSVSKAFYVEPDIVKLPQADDLISMSNSLNPTAKRGKWRVMQMPNTFVEKRYWRPPMRARLTMFSSHERAFPFDPEKSPVAKIVKYMAKGALSKRLQHQLKFYEHASHLVLMTERRKLDGLNPPSYKRFPFIFLDSSLLYYDLEENDSRLLRCEWYDEQSFWGTRNMEDLALAYVLGRRRVQGKHGPVEGQDWTPLMKPNGIEDGGEKTVNKKDVELFLRVIRAPKRREN